MREQGHANGSTKGHPQSHSINLVALALPLSPAEQRSPHAKKLLDGEYFRHHLGRSPFGSKCSMKTHENGELEMR